MNCLQRVPITAINQSGVVSILVGLFLLLVALLVALIALDAVTLPFLLGGLALPILLFFYLKKHFTHSLVLELFGDRITVANGPSRREVLYQDIASYQVERYDGIRFVIRLVEGKRLTIIATANFGSTPEPLEAFYRAFEEQLRRYQLETGIAIARRKSFWESRWGAFVTVLASAISIAGVLVAWLRDGFSLNLLFFLGLALSLLAPSWIYLKSQEKDASF